MWEWTGVTQCPQGIYIADHKREHPGSVVQELKLQPPWNFILFCLALDKSDTAMGCREVLLTQTEMLFMKSNTSAKLLHHSVLSSVWWNKQNIDLTSWQLD
jgi:hypothetical protein